MFAKYGYSKYIKSKKVKLNATISARTLYVRTVIAPWTSCSKNAVCAHCDPAVNELQQLHTRRNLERHGRCTDAVETSCVR